MENFFAQNLRYLRRLHQMSQTKLGEEVGLKRNQIATYEKGLAYPNAAMLMKLSTYFNVELGHFIESDLVHNTLESSISDVEPLPDERFQDFIHHTREMTKILEGYKILYELKIEKAVGPEELKLYLQLMDLMQVLETLIHSNWSLIQSMYEEE